MTPRLDWDNACHRCGQVRCGCAQLGRPQAVAFKPTRELVAYPTAQQRCDSLEVVFEPFVEHRSPYWEGPRFSWAGGNAEHDPGDEDPSSVRWRTGR